VITKDDCKKITEKVGTLGGVTYIIVKNGETKPRALCFRRLRGKDENGNDKNPLGLYRCSRPAGYKTDHLGEGACNLHGGSNANQSVIIKNIKSGKGSVQTRKLLADKINNYLENDVEELYDLSKELAAMRAIFDEILRDIPDPTNSEADKISFHGDVGRLIVLVETIGTLLDKISRVQNRNTLTTAQVLYFRATISDIFIKYIKDPIIREEAVKELANRVMGTNLPDHSLVRRESWESVDGE